MESIYHEIPRIYTALAEWSSCVIYLLLLKKSGRKRFFLPKSFIALVVQVLFLELTGGLPTVLWIPCMTTAALFMYIFILICGKVTAKEGLYCCAKAFLLAELAASLEWQIHTYLLAFGISSYIGQIFLLLLVYTAVFLFAYYMEKAMFSKSYLSQLSRKEVLAAIGCVVAIFAFSNMSFVVTNTLFTTRIKSDVVIIRTLIDMMGVAILYAYQSRICEYAAEAEMNALENTLKSQYEQYRNYLDSAEMIQIKFHDLKHQIAGLRAETDAEKRKDWLDAMEQELNANEITMDTGNKVLDAILGAKSLRAKKNHIQMTCVINGELLKFLHVTDICSIFGNALDNALENAILIDDERKRLIHISVSEQKGFIFIKIANYCETPVKFTSGKMPETTKLDKKNHGFGLKSIRQSVEKYGGTVTTVMNQSWFVLNLLFPKTEVKTGD
ncbi:GHKL domain-containing protein [Lachnospiraceae bacterium OttesenSCG-928-D06]|nr:GHKL domain-containing protein [Lachnospiraceae bacterium OttesenSCG-928-D06]